MISSSKPIVVFYISGHGFGHSSRQIEIIRQLQRLRNDVHVIIKTPTPHWFFDVAGLEKYSFETIETDTGVVQTDSLHVDVVRSIKQCDSFHRTLGQRAASEVTDLRGLNVRLIVGDIPPLAFRVGIMAAIPTVAISNFTWDWIYDNYADTATCAPGLVDTLSDAQITINSLDAAIDFINDQRSNLGAVQNRLGFADSNLMSSIQNTESSLSTIRDADFALEASNLTRTQILTQSGTAMLAQANQISQNILSLLQ